MDIGAPELIIVLLIVLLFWGPGRIKDVGSELGKSISAFRRGLQGDGDQNAPEDSGKDSPA